MFDDMRGNDEVCQSERRRSLRKGLLSPHAIDVHDFGHVDTRVVAVPGPQRFRVGVIDVEHEESQACKVPRFLSLWLWIWTDPNHVKVSRLYSWLNVFQTIVFGGYFY